MTKKKKKTPDEAKQAVAETPDPRSKPRERVKLAVICYSPQQFCDVSGISRSLLYKLWREDQGPPYGFIRGRRVVPHEGAMQWLQQLPKNAAA